MAVSNRKCANPSCGMSLAGHKTHSLTCSPRCRRAVWRARHQGELKHNKLKRPVTMTIPQLDLVDDPHLPKRKKRRAK